MSQQPKEMLSALMDNEGSDFELRRVLEQATDDKQMTERWRRYHIASSALKQESCTTGDISAAVMAALDDEPAYQQAPVQETRRDERGRAGFFKPLVSMAVAASVTAMVILGGQNFGVGVSTTDNTVATAVPGYSLPALTAPTDFMRAQFGRPATQPDAGQEADIIRLNTGLNSYIRQHQVLTTTDLVSSNPGWIPEGYAPVKSAVAPGTDITVFSNGTNAFTVSIERTGNAQVPEGATQIGDMVAVGKRHDQLFITVVGDVPLLVADRVVNSLSGTH